MKIIITLENGKKVQGKNWQDLLLNLKNPTQFDGQDIEEYMAGAAERIRILHEKSIKYNDPKSFFEELQRMGIIEMEVQEDS